MAHRPRHHPPTTSHLNPPQCTSYNHPIRSPHASNLLNGKNVSPLQKRNRSKTKPTDTLALKTIQYPRRRS